MSMDKCVTCIASSGNRCRLCRHNGFGLPDNPNEPILAEATGGCVISTAMIAKVKAGLLGDQTTSGLAILVKIAGGVVQWSGFMDDAGEKERAAEIAQGIEGVKDGKSDIRVDAEVKP